MSERFTCLFCLESIEGRPHPEILEFPYDEIVTMIRFTHPADRSRPVNLCASCYHELVQQSIEHWHKEQSLPPQSRKGLATFTCDVCHTRVTDSDLSTRGFSWTEEGSELHLFLHALPEDDDGPDVKICTDCLLRLAITGLMQDCRED